MQRVAFVYCAICYTQLLKRSGRRQNGDLFQLFDEPVVQPTVPVEVRADGTTTAAIVGTLGFLPLLLTGRAAPCGFESIPQVPAGAHPPGAAIGFPVALWAENFHGFRHGFEFWVQKCGQRLPVESFRHELLVPSPHRAPA